MYHCLQQAAAHSIDARRAGRLLDHIVTPVFFCLLLLQPLRVQIAARDQRRPLLERGTTVQHGNERHAMPQPIDRLQWWQKRLRPCENDGARAPAFRLGCRRQGRRQASRQAAVNFLPAEAGEEVKIREAVETMRTRSYRTFNVDRAGVEDAGARPWNYLLEFWFQKTHGDPHRSCSSGCLAT